ncbi:hypothetical protein CH380_13050 [Leptospira adleri]|uniref:Uncharacterized protein n=1 Tax=Leptospira adleri TaxID=2023186 RepID=A0A2M9YMA9_9LEPT|nr:hypothetical protein CH380_13050 [Leptospira adleri]PJZ60497.1 hypothetical protein CH376_18235 [Leptospira adleri]
MYEFLLFLRRTKFLRIQKKTKFGFAKRLSLLIQFMSCFKTSTVGTHTRIVPKDSRSDVRKSVEKT